MPGNPDLFGDPNAAQGDDESAPSSFFAAIEAVEAKLGRPRGARNRKSEAFEKWFYAKGYKDPAQYLAEIVTADPLALKAAIAGDAALIDIVKLQISAAGELMPYLHGKKPTQVEVGIRALPVLGVMNGTDQLSEAAKIIEGRELMRLPIEANEINDLGGDDK